MSSSSELKRITIYRDDSTAKIVHDNVKHHFWTANNTVLTVAILYHPDEPGHYYRNYLRERIHHFTDEPMPLLPTEGLQPVAVSNPSPRGRR